MKEKLKKISEYLFYINEDEILENKQVIYILTIYALVGLVIHPILGITFFTHKFITFGILEYIYISYIMVLTLLRRRISVYNFASLTLAPTTLLLMIYLYYLNWDFGYHLYALLEIPVLVYLRYKLKITKPLMLGGTVLLYLCFYLYSIYDGHAILETSMPMQIFFAVLNMIKVSFCIFAYMMVTKQSTDLVIRKLSRAKDVMDKESKIDHLTGLYNRRSMDKFLEVQAEQYKITNKTFGMILMDIDFFKKVNDTYGHLAGDKVLTELARLVMYTLRKSDSVFRYGGEEFLAIIPGVQNEHEALDVANGIRKDVEKLNIDIGDRDINITISLGVTLYDGLDMESNIQRVDDALYKSKNNGRNRAEFL